MRIGIEDRAKAGAAVGLLLLGFGLIGRWAIGTHSLEAPAGHTSVRLSGSQTAPDSGRSVSFDVGLDLDGLRATEDLRYAGAGRDIFNTVEERPVKREQRREPPQPDPPKMNVIIPIPLAFFGFLRKEGTRSIFLLKGEDVFIAREGDIIDRRYKIVRVMPNAVDIEDLLNNQSQKLWLSPGL
ncbi:MAG TPA: hypothetical protein VLL05_09405 [Terriglobales bacterium]|nr:hypothetical protein [Terriglobales bacterium]